eukprot:5544807-Alexandrium_andersonii.AAC.1
MVLVGATQATAAFSTFTTGPFAWTRATAFHEERLTEMAQAVEEALRALDTLAERDSPQMPNLQVAFGLARQRIHS